MLGVLVMIVVEVSTYYVRDQFHQSFYGAKPHRVPCKDWLTPGEVQRILEDHLDVVHRIEAINPGFVAVNVNTISCPGKADIRIYYATAADRQAIKSELGESKYLFGVPYQLHNW